MNRLLLISATIALIHSTQLIAQPVDPLIISFTMPGYSEKVVTIGYFYGNNTYLIDSVRLDKEGTKIYTGEYHEGLFLLVLPDSSVFEFMVTNGTSYNISCTDSGDINRITLKANQVADAYVDFSNCVRQHNHAIDSLKDLLQTTDDFQQKNKLKKDLNYKKEQLDSITNSYIEAQRGTLPGNYINAQQPIKMQHVREVNGKMRNDSLQWITSLNYYREHYFDNVNWNDPRLIYTPIIADKIDHYLENVSGKQPENLLNAIDHILNLPKNTATRDFILKYLFMKYEETLNKAINEYLFLHILDKYIFVENISWIDNEKISRLKTEYAQRKPVALFTKAPEISLPDKNNDIQSLYAIRADYTIIFFWDYSCNTCRRVLTDLVESISTYNPQYVSIYTVYTGTDLDIWRAFLEKRIPRNWINTYQAGSLVYTDLFNISHTPTLYLLDRNKQILDKGLTVPEVDAFLSRAISGRKIME